MHWGPGSEAALQGRTLRNPLPLTDYQEKHLKFGLSVGQYGAYESYRKMIVEDFTTFVGRLSKPCSDDDFFEQDTFDRLCDLEVATNILLSESSELIVYVGAWHADGISQLLRTQLGYRSVYTVFNDSSEVNPKALELLAQSPRK